MSAPYRFELTGGVRDPEQMRLAAERRGRRGSRGRSMVERDNHCSCCGQLYVRSGRRQFDCLSCVRLIPFRMRRLGRQVLCWSPRRSRSNSECKRRVA
jgi:hypothetical protein